MSNNNGSVAIVDDETQLVRTYEMIFKRRNIPMSFVAYDGPDAIDKFKKVDPKPIVVIIDYRLLSTSGMDVMKEILAIEPNTKVIFISGDESIQQESLDAGATAFMKKPTSIKEITETINTLLNN